MLNESKNEKENLQGGRTMRYAKTLLGGLLAPLACGLALAQSNVQPEAQKHIDAAKAAAAASPFPKMADRCGTNGGNEGGQEDKDRVTGVPPVKLFDNVYYVGLKGIGVLVVKTSDGIALIDSL